MPIGLPCPQPLSQGLAKSTPKPVESWLNYRITGSNLHAKSAAVLGEFALHPGGVLSGPAGNSRAPLSTLWKGFVLSETSQMA